MHKTNEYKHRASKIKKDANEANGVKQQQNNTPKNQVNTANYDTGYGGDTDFELV